ncbi:putative GABA permease [compost metagenome]
MLESLNVPYAKLIVDIIVLVSVTSCLNSALYTASRMLFSLSKRGDAPRIAQVTYVSRTPVFAVLLSTAMAFLCTFANYLAPAEVFNFLLASSGAIALLVYLVIAISQLRMRQKLLASGHQLTLKMWLFPWLTWAVIVFIVFALGVMFVMPQHRIEVTATLVLAGGILLIGVFNHRQKAQPGRLGAVGKAV